MSDTIRRLRLAVVASLSILAVGASGASAEPMFHSEAHHTIGTGEQVGAIVFTVNAGTVECPEATGEGTIAKTTVTEFTAIVTYNECEAFGLEAGIEMNGCQIRITAIGEGHLICPKGKMVEVITPLCRVSVGSQSATSIEYENVGEGAEREVIAKEEAENIHYVQNGVLCAGGTGTFQNGTAEGVVRTKGENSNGEPVGVWWTDE